MLLLVHVCRSTEPGSRKKRMSSRYSGIYNREAKQLQSHTTAMCMRQMCGILLREEIIKLWTSNFGMQEQCRWTQRWMATHSTQTCQAMFVGLLLRQCVPARQCSLAFCCNNEYQPSAKWSQKSISSERPCAQEGILESVSPDSDNDYDGVCSSPEASDLS